MLVAIFGIGFYRLSQNIPSRLGAVFVIAIGILGIIITWFPINTKGTEITFVGIGHIILVSVISLLTVIADFLLWVAFRKSHLKFIAKISLAAGIGFLVTGPIAAIFVMSPYAGLLERVPIGIFLSWILLVSIFMLRTKKVY